MAAEPQAVALVLARLGRALLRELHEELAAIARVAGPLDEPRGLQLGEQLGERARFEIKAHAQLLLRERAARLGERAENGRLSRTSSPMEVHVVTAVTQERQDLAGARLLRGIRGTARVFEVLHGTRDSFHSVPNNEQKESTEVPN